MDIQKPGAVKKEIRSASDEACGQLKNGMPEYAVARLKEAYGDDAARGMAYREIKEKSVNPLFSAD